MLHDYLLDLIHKSDIITITETWFYPSTDLSLFQLYGYKICHLNRGNKNGVGVAMYIQNTLRHSNIIHMTYTIDDVLEHLLVEVFSLLISCLCKHKACTIY